MTKRKGRKRARLAAEGAARGDSPRGKTIFSNKTWGNHWAYGPPQRMLNLSERGSSVSTTTARLLRRPTTTKVLLAPTRKEALTEAALQLFVQSGLLPSWTDSVELQLVSLAVCETCRRYTPTRVRVGRKTPKAIWARHPSGVETESVCRSKKRGGAAEIVTNIRIGGRGCNDDKPNSTPKACLASLPLQQRRKLPPVQISSIIWECPAKDLGNGSDLPAGLRELKLSRDFNRTLEGFQWPPELKALTFGTKFNRSIIAGGTSDSSCSSSSSRLPKSLVELTFGKHFNKPLPKALPAGLVSLTLGRKFRRALHEVVWPAGLKVVNFGEAMFGRRLSGTLHAEHVFSGLTWPAGLDRIEFYEVGKHSPVDLRGEEH